MKNLVILFALACSTIATQAAPADPALIRQDLFTILEEGFVGYDPSDDYWMERYQCEVIVDHQLQSSTITIRTQDKNDYSFTFENRSKVQDFESNLGTASFLGYRFLRLQKRDENGDDAIKLEITKTESNREFVVTIGYPKNSTQAFGLVDSTISCMVEN